MNYGCLSCGAEYSIPDTRVQKAGVDGLRVRCSRCRAIMAVSQDQLALQLMAADPVKIKRTAFAISIAWE